MICYRFPDNSELELIYLLKTTGLTNLTVAANSSYELWINNQFVTTGGHRCTDNEMYSNSWNLLATDAITIRYQWLNHKINVWYRKVFPVAYISANTSFTVSLDPNIKFGNKICAQLSHQIILTQPIKVKTIQLEQTSCPHAIKPLPVKLPIHIKSTPKLISRAKPVVPHANFKNLLFTTTNLRYDTYDLGQIALHRFEITTGNRGIVLYYGEVPDLDKLLNVPNRSKVKLADAIEPDIKGAIFGYRGCRYVNVIYSGVPNIELNVWRSQYDFNWIETKTEFKSILDACKNNLIACVDGGVVDTCWRERAQWVGDARISLLALKVLTTNTEVIEFVLDQISQSYDKETGMVQGAYPIKNDCKMPTYHLHWCYAMIEHGFTQLVIESLKFWKANYVVDGILVGMPGWYFLDWDKDNDLVSDRSRSFRNRAHSVCNAMYYDLCGKVGIESGIDLVKFNSMFCWNGHGYSLEPGGLPNLHATSMVMLSLRNGIGFDYVMNCDLIPKGDHRVTAYFAYFVAKAIGLYSVTDMLMFVKNYYGPIADAHGTIYEKANANASMAHGWSVGVAELII